MISIWMDDTCISYPTVENAITDGRSQITGNFDYESAKDLADKISAGALPYKLETSNFRTISASMGTGARNAMLIAGVIAFVLVALYMIIVYRLPGVVSSIALVGQVVGNHCLHNRLLRKHPKLYPYDTRYRRYHIGGRHGR